MAIYKEEVKKDSVRIVNDVFWYSSFPKFPLHSDSSVKSTRGKHWQCSQWIKNFKSHKSLGIFLWIRGEGEEVQEYRILGVRSFHFCQTPAPWSKKTSQECETALTSQYKTLFLVFVSFCPFVLSPFCIFVGSYLCLFVSLIKCLWPQKSFLCPKF